MAFRYLFVPAIIVSAFSHSPALAANRQDAAACDQMNNIDAKIAGCGRFLDSAGLTKEMRANAYNNRCLAFYIKREYKRALDDCSEAIRSKPTHVLAYNGRGNAWRALGEPEKAVSDLDEAIRLNPKFDIAFANRAAAFLDLKLPDKAMDDINVAIKFMPNKSAHYVYRGAIWSSKREYDQAIADYSTALRLDPTNRYCLGLRAGTFLKKGDLQQALADADRQVRNQPDYAEGLLARAEILRYRNDFSRAMDDYARVLKLRPGSIEAFTGLGLTYEKMGENDRAAVEFRNAINSNEPERTRRVLSELDTANARLAALNSGEAQPVIPAAPAKAASTTSVPTPQISTVKPLRPERAQATARQGRRVALVIGNSKYRTVSTLVNPRNDADAIAKSLRNIGFEIVTLTNDATREALVDALRLFANEAENSDWAMVYYAGHGIEVGGVNYLVPVDAKLAVDRDIEYEAVPLSQVLRATNAAKKIKLVMLDACRDNPFAPRKTDASASIAANESTAGRAIASRSTNGRGLAEVKVAGATLVVFAAKDGEVALDGEGSNSPFAVAVAQRLGTPGVEINKLFRLVRDDVMEATAGRQEPYTYGSLPGKEDFFFVAK
jgi:tetratricopeptide (TPR) repeat protein